MISVSATNGSSRHRVLECAIEQAAKYWKDGATEVTVKSDSGAAFQLERSQDGVYGCLRKCFEVQLWQAYAAKYGLPCPSITEFVAAKAKLQSWQRLD